MRFWWVNQNMTYREEIGGGYMWSPKCNNNGTRNQFYENMKLVNIGDVVFSGSVVCTYYLCGFGLGCDYDKNLFYAKNIE